jgi:predicted  nucleic acid-binding Zn-ribbon protein
LAHSAERNSEFFDDEVDKLDKWAEDMKKALELDLKKLDIDIKTAKTNAKKIVELEEKVKVQRQIKNLEKKRNEMRKKLYDSQDDVDKRKEQLIDKVEAQLKQKTKIEELFSVRWRVI